MLFETTAIVVQARMESTRLPGKVLREIQGRPMIFHLLNRLQAIPSHIVIAAISSARESDPLYWELLKNRYNVFRGDPVNVYGRIASAIRDLPVDIIVRVTADNPLTDCRLIGEGCRRLWLDRLDYLWMNNVPVGMGCDIFRRETFFKIFEEDLKPDEQEHVVTAFRNRKHLKGAGLESHYPAGADTIRVTVDTETDFTHMVALFEQYAPGYQEPDIHALVHEALQQKVRA